MAIFGELLSLTICHLVSQIRIRQFRHRATRMLLDNLIQQLPRTSAVSHQMIDFAEFEGRVRYLPIILENVMT